MKKLLLILLCLPFIGFGQTWELTFGGVNIENGMYVQQTIDGGYIVAAYTAVPASGNGDVYLIKTDSNGIEQWNQTFGGTSNDFSKSVQQTTDGGYIITGSTGSFGNGDNDVYLIKIDSNGIEQWTQTFGGADDDRGNSVQQTTDGGYIIVGETKSFGNGGFDVWLIKTDSNGIEQWNQTFGGIFYDGGHSVQQTTDGGYVITGHTGYVDTTATNGTNYDVYIIKTDGNGIEQWNHTNDWSWLDYSYSIQQTTEGGYIVTGYKWTSSIYAYLLKIDSTGIEQWYQTYYLSNSVFGQSVQQTIDGGYIITGSMSMAGGDKDIFLLKTDGIGIEQWHKNFGGADDDWGNSVQQTTDGGYIIAGQTKSFGNGNSDVYLIKTDSNGCVSTSTQTTATSCDSYTWNGNTYTTSGTYNETFTNGAGCDSVATLDLTINSNTGTSAVTACGSYTWDGAAYTASGAYTNTYTNVAGCDSVHTLGLTILPIPISNIYQNNSNLSVIPNSGLGPYTYMWSTMETTQSITPASFGTYWAFITAQNGCNSDTLFYNYTSTAISENNTTKKLLSIVNNLGQETPFRRSTPLFYIYDDGTVEKRIVIE